MSNFLTDFLRRPGGVSDPFELMRREMERMMGDRYQALGPAFQPGFAPAIDVRSTETGLEITAELPGVAETDIALDLHEDLLTLSGEKKTEKEEKTDGRMVSERAWGSFSRTVRLPFAPEPDKVTAKFEKGVLTIAAPKPAEVAARTRRIAIG